MRPATCSNPKGILRRRNSLRMTARGKVIPSKPESLPAGPTQCFTPEVKSADTSGVLTAVRSWIERPKTIQYRDSCYSRRVVMDKKLSPVILIPKQKIF